MRCLFWVGNLWMSAKSRLFSGNFALGGAHTVVLGGDHGPSDMTSRRLTPGLVQKRGQVQDPQILTHNLGQVSGVRSHISYENWFPYPKTSLTFACTFPVVPVSCRA